RPACCLLAWWSHLSPPGSPTPTRRTMVAEQAADTKVSFFVREVHFVCDGCPGAPGGREWTCWRGLESTALLAMLLVLSVLGRTICFEIRRGPFSSPWLYDSC